MMSSALTLLMKSADRRIATLNDPSLVPLRKVMAKDITALKTVPLIDQDGLALKLMSLQEQVATLPLANAILPKAKKEVEQVVSNNISDWKNNLLTSSKNFLKSFITFRARDGHVVPLLSPQQDFYLRENIKDKLGMAIKSVYSEQGSNYQTSIKMALQWSTTFFNQNSDAVKGFQQQLTEVAAINVAVKYPVQLQSQAALSKVIAKRLRHSISPLNSSSKKSTSSTKKATAPKKTTKPVQSINNNQAKGDRIMVKILFLFTVLGLGLFLGTNYAGQQGYVLISIADKTLEMSVTTLVIFLVGGLGGLFLAESLIAKAMTLSSNTWNWFSVRKSKRSRRLTNQAVIKLVEGDWQNAEKKANSLGESS